jgi:phosphomannomutase
MKFTQSIFKAYDIRGVVHTELTNELAYAVGVALADFLPREGPVAVGRDMRPDSIELAEQVRMGLIAQGRTVWDIGQVTSDMIYFAVGNYGLAGGAMITASHNPGKYNGIKLCREEARPVGLEMGLSDIRDAIAGDHFKETTGIGEVIEKDIVEDWIDHSLSFVDVDKWPAYKIAVDAGNGMAGAIIPHLEGKTPLQITPMYFELDGTFPNHPANPLLPEGTADLRAKVKAEGLDFGVAFDGDGDRAFLVDNEGNLVTGGQMSAMLAAAFLAKFPGANIVYDARNSHTVPEVIAELGGKAVISKVGHSNIKAVMREADAPFGGEFSGHYYFRDNFYADSGLIGALMAIDVLAKSGKKLSELAADYTHYAGSGEINSDVKDKDAKIEELSEKFKDGEQNRLDGLTVVYPDWWFNVRPSNTEPLLRLNVESKTQADMEAKRDELLDLIRA